MNPSALNIRLLIPTVYYLFIKECFEGKILPLPDGCKNNEIMNEK